MGVPFRVVLLQSLLVLTPLAYAQTAPVQSLVVNWNLVGNNSPASIDPISMFGNLTTPVTGISDQINTVWKWNTAAGGSWMFYAPSLDATGLAAYATSKSYGVLSTIPSGDGYWVNAKAPLTLTLPSGTPAGTAPSQILVSGWNLAGNNTPAAIDPITLFGNTSAPLSGITSQIQTVWTWDAANARWMFYAPSLTAAELATYAASKGYGVLTTILPGDGFWVNSVAALSLALPPTLSGVAATGAPMGGATVTLTCGDGTTRTTTADAGGAYAFGLTSCAGPYALNAVAQIGDTEISLVSLQTDPGTGGSNLTVNATPITHALASTVASTGNPYDLLTNYSTEKANITQAKVNASEQAFRTVLGPVLTSVGAATTDNLISTPFKADGASSMDKVLDMVQVAVQQNGDVNMYTAKGAMADDQGDLSAAPAAGSVLVLNKGTLPQTSDAASLPASASNEILTIAMLENARKALQACFKLASTARGNYQALLGDCAAMPLKPYVDVNNQYRHQGRNGSQEFNNMLADSSLDGAVFFKPNMLRQLSATSALVAFPFQKVNGFAGGLTTVVANVNNVWTLVGNSRIFEVFVNGSVTQRNYPGTPANSRIETGINIYVRNNPAFPNDANIVSVTVFGPALPGYVDVNNMGTGKPLLKKTGCDFMTLNSTTCGTIFRFASNYIATGLPFTPNANQNPEYFASPALTDTQILAIKPLSLYKFVITTTTGTVTYWDRLRARALTAGETLQARFLILSDASKNLLQTYTGGTPPTITWTRPANTAPAYTTYFFHNAYSDNANVKLSDLSATINCAGNADCLSGGNGAYNPLTLATNSTNFFQMIARNRYDVQIFSQFVK
jgi:hypothetical protein